MITDFEHVGMSVADMERTLWFYVSTLGLTLVLRKSGPGGEIAFLQAPGAMLEISAPAGELERSVDVPPSRAGLRHITFRVADLDDAFNRLTALGVEVVEPPRDAHNTEMLSRTGFVRDPDGIIVELIEK